MGKRIGRWWLVSSGLLFGFYCLNVALGKIALVSNQKPLFSMGDVGWRIYRNCRFGLYSKNP